MKFKPLRKDRYNHWKVESDPFKIGKQYYVKATCMNCNKTTKNVQKNRLLNGESKSCGCVQRNNLVNTKKGKRAWNSVDILTRESKILYQSYKHGAKKRDLSFKITIEYFKKLIQQPCIYCGSINTNQRNTRKGIFKYNGIDRWDNNKGYEVDNVVTCCFRCNMMKRDMEDGISFIEHINRIFKNYEKGVEFTESKLEKYEKRLDAIKINSHDKETKVSAILIDVKTGAVVAEGYNGFVRGADDKKLPNTRPDKYPYMMHAETNVICNAIRSGVSTDGKVLFCTLSPCVNCSRMLYQSGIQTVYFSEKYRDFDKQQNMLDLNLDVVNIGKYYKMTISPRRLG